MNLAPRSWLLCIHIHNKRREIQRKGSFLCWGRKSTKSWNIFLYKNVLGKWQKCVFKKLKPNWEGSLRPHTCMLSHVQLFATPWTVALQAALSMGFSRREYWVGGHLLLQGIILTQRLTPVSLESPALQMDSLPTALPHWGQCENLNK